MNFQNYFKELKNSQEYKDFMKENPDAFLAGAFFIIDLKFNGKENHQSLDFYIPKNKEMFSFFINENSETSNKSHKVTDFKKSRIDLIDKENIPRIIKEDLDFDIEKISELLQKKVEYEKINNSIQKILFSLQIKINVKKDEYFLVGTVFLDKMGLIKFVIDIEEMNFVEFEKKNFFDILRPVKK